MTRGADHLTWRTSSYSSNGANCVEVAVTAVAVHARDSKDPAGPKLNFGTAGWARFQQHVAQR